MIVSLCYTLCYPWCCSWCVCLSMSVCVCVSVYLSLYLSLYLSVVSLLSFQISLGSLHAGLYSRPGTTSPAGCKDCANNRASCDRDYGTAFVCPTGWTKWTDSVGVEGSDSCLLSGGEQVTWDVAVAACDKKVPGAHLVTSKQVHCFSSHTSHTSLTLHTSHTTCTTRTSTNITHIPYVTANTLDTSL